MLQKNIVKLHCLTCKEYLGQYNPETKLYKPHIPKNRQLGNDFLVLPAIFTNKDNQTEKLFFSENDFNENKEIFGKDDDSLKTKYLAKFQYNYLNNKGLVINKGRIKDIECGNYFTDCPKCNTHYNFEILRLEGKDDPQIKWA
jgi:hypothetical protein